jgi:hypothetical protein
MADLQAHASELARELLKFDESDSASAAGKLLSGKALTQKFGGFFTDHKTAIYVSAGIGAVVLAIVGYGIWKRYQEKPADEPKA